MCLFFRVSLSHNLHSLLVFPPEDEGAAAELAWIAGQFAHKEEHPGEPHSGSKGEDLLAMMDELGPAAEATHQQL